MKNIIKIIMGSLVGMGSILPGISGSMVATILKIYQDLITALNNFTKNPIKAVLSVWQYIVGVILGYIIGFFFISTFLGLAPLPFTLLFIGFILGAVPSLKKKQKRIIIIGITSLFWGLRWYPWWASCSFKSLQQHQEADSIMLSSF